jgi:hypothetical protein
VQTLLHLRREHDALRGGKLWHLAADDSSYIFIRRLLLTIAHRKSLRRFLCAIHRAITPFPFLHFLAMPGLSWQAGNYI